MRIARGTLLVSLCAAAAAHGELLLDYGIQHEPYDVGWAINDNTNVGKIFQAQQFDVGGGGWEIEEFMVYLHGASAFNSVKPLLATLHEDDNGLPKLTETLGSPFQFALADDFDEGWISLGLQAALEPATYWLQIRVKPADDDGQVFFSGSWHDASGGPSGVTIFPEAGTFFEHQAMTLQVFGEVVPAPGPAWATMCGGVLLAARRRRP